VASGVTALEGKADGIIDNDPKQMGEGKSLLPRLVELSLLAVIGALLALSLWRLITPIAIGQVQAISAPAQNIAEDYRLLTSFDPFSRTAVTAQPSYNTAQETSLDIQLLGAWREQEGGGAVILKLGNGEQKVFEVGDEISPGITLEEIHPGQAIISRNGVREQVSIDWMREMARQQAQGDNFAEMTMDTSMGANAGGNISPQALFELGGLRPVRDGEGRVMAYEIFATGPENGSEQALNQLGIYTGDRILMINDQPAPSSPDEIISLMQKAGNQPMTILLDRDGAIVPLQVEAQREAK
jgi:general secretion pathway protein C